MSEKDKRDIQRALGYIEGVADASLNAATGALVIEAVRMIDEIVSKEEQNNEMD